MSGGGGSVSPPPVDPQQQALEAQQTQMLQEQTAILKQQQADNQVVAPVLYQSLGLDAAYNPDGTLKSLTQNPQVAANNSLQLQVNNLQLNREQQALTGNLPVNPLVTQELDRQQQQLNNTLSNNLGPGYGASTPGQTAQNNFNVTRAGIIQAANTGDMTLSQQLASAGTANYIGSTSNTLQDVTGVNNLGFQLAGAYGANAYGYGQAQAPYIQRSQQSLQANMANAQLGAQASAGTGQLIGAGVGIAAMAAIVL